MWLLRDYTSGLGHCTLSKQLRNSVLNSLNSAKVYIMEQHTADEFTIHNDGKQMMGGGRINFDLCFVSSTDKHAVKNQNWQYYNAQ